MKNSRSASLFLLLAIILSFVPSNSFASGGEQNAADVVVLLDVSQSVLPYFQDVTQFVVYSVAKDFLRLGDTFHLLSFGDSAQVEIAQPILRKQDVDSILGRLYLLYPLARHSDFAGALAYLYQYLADLPESRPKIVIVITDGVNNPPSGASTFGFSVSDTRASIISLATKIRANGWPVHFISLPFAVESASGSSTQPGAQALSTEAKAGESFIAAAASASGGDVSEFAPNGKRDIAIRSLGLPSAEFPPPLGKIDYSFSFPLKLTNHASQPISLELERVLLNNANVLAQKSFLNLGAGTTGTMSVSIVLPESIEQGNQELDLSLFFANGVRVNPQTGRVIVELVHNPLAAIFRSGLMVILFLAILAAASVLIAILIFRYLPKKASDAPVVAAVLESNTQNSAGSTAARQKPEPFKASEQNAKRKVSESRRDVAISETNKSVTATTSFRLKSSNEVPVANWGATAVPTGVDSKVLSERTKIDRNEKAEEESRLLAASQEITRSRKAEEAAAAKHLAEAAAERRRMSLSIAKKTEPKFIEQRRDKQRSTYTPRIAKPGSIRLEMQVVGQNSHIGTRNVHTLHSGSHKTMGGGTSDFLVFLLHVPSKIAEIHFDGEIVTLVPLSPEFFPSIDGKLEDCLGKDVPFVSSRGAPLTARFQLYERPEEKTNRLLRCIDTPGHMSGEIK